MNATFAPPISARRAVPTKRLPSRSRVKFALLSQDVMLQLTLRRMIEALPQNCILESYLKHEEALPFLDLAPPAVLLIDIRSARDRGRNWLRKLRIRYPHLPILMVAEPPGQEEIVQALSAGASGYLITPLAPKQLADSLRAADRGWPSLCQQAQQILVDWFLTRDDGRWHDVLSSREKQLIPFLLGTLPDRHIARLLGLPQAAADEILAHLLKKLMAGNRREAVTNLIVLVQGRPLHFAPHTLAK